jgi:S1-C subfamily serine protease
LVDANGELVGINTAIVGDTFRGVSFSIPSNVAREVYKRLKADGRFERGWLGISLEEVPDELMIGEDYRTRGALVTSLAGVNGPAARGGVKGGDIILRLNDQPIKDVGHLMRLAGNLASGTAIVLEARRGTELVTIDMTVGARPENMSSR